MRSDQKLRPTDVDNAAAAPPDAESGDKESGEEPAQESQEIPDTPVGINEVKLDIELTPKKVEKTVEEAKTPEMHPQK